MIKNGVYEFYFASCMNIIFNELRKTYILFFYHILFLLLIYQRF